MNRQEIELRFLHQQHLANIMALEQQRKLLARDHPVEPLTTRRQQRPVPIQKLPILKPDSYVQKMLYCPPHRLDSQNADKQIKGVLQHWSSQCNQIPKDVQVQHYFKYGKQKDPGLTENGQLYINELIDNARKHRESFPLHPIRQKYGHRLWDKPNKERQNY